MLLRLSIANGIALMLLWVGENLIGERWWVTTFLAYAPQQPFAIPTALLVLSSLWRRGPTLAINTAAAIFVLFALLGFQLPPQHPRAAGTTVRVMTYNIDQGSMGIDHVLDVIHGEHPDVLCLQETNAAPHGRDPAPAVVRALAGYHVVRGGEVTLASRYPITSRRVLPLAFAGVHRAAILATLKVNGRAVTVLNVHFVTGLAATPATRRRTSPAHWSESASVHLAQADTLLRAVKDIRGPVVVCGDFNTPPAGLTYRRLSTELSDAFEAAGSGFGYTWETHLPVLRIDHIFTGHDAHTASVRTIPREGSDHRPILAEVTLP